VREKEPAAELAEDAGPDQISLARDKEHQPGRPVIPNEIVELTFRLRIGPVPEGRHPTAPPRDDEEEAGLGRLRSSFRGATPRRSFGEPCNDARCVPQIVQPSVGSGSDMVLQMGQAYVSVENVQVPWAQAVAELARDARENRARYGGPASDECQMSLCLWHPAQRSEPLLLRKIGHPEQNSAPPDRRGPGVVRKRGSDRAPRRSPAKRAPCRLRRLHKEARRRI
jgi:hypothetical protein